MGLPDPKTSKATEPGGTGWTQSSWPVVVVIEDCYIPEWAGEVVKLAANTPTETNYAVIHALAVFAEVGLVRERLN